MEQGVNGTTLAGPCDSPVVSVLITIETYIYIVLIE